MLTAHAQEWHAEPGSTPLVTVDFVTVTNNPYRLFNPVMFGEGVLGLDSHEEVRGGNCDTWRPEEIPADLYSDLYYCQEWHVEFYHENKCNSDRRDVILRMNATNTLDLDATYDLAPEWLLSFGFSSAFECAQDVGQFEVSVNILTSLDGVEYDVPRLGYLNDRFYFRLSFSSGDIMTGAELVQMQITTQEGNPICADCINSPALDVNVINTTYDDYRFDMILHESVFQQHNMVNFILDFEVFRDGGGRRFLSESSAIELRLALQVMSSLDFKGSEYLNTNSAFIFFIIMNHTHTRFIEKYVNHYRYQVFGTSRDYRYT